MKYRASMLMFGIGVAVGVVASAVAETGTDVERSASLFSKDPKECETVVSTLLQRKKEALDRRERTIKVRETDLRTAEERMKQQLTELSTIREELREQMKDMDEKQLQEIERLVRLFEKMRAPQAAAILEATDPTIAVSVLRRMDRSRAGKALAKMKAKTAANLAELMTVHPIKNKANQ